MTSRSGGDGGRIDETGVRRTAGAAVPLARFDRRSARSARLARGRSRIERDASPFAARFEEGDLVGRGDFGGHRAWLLRRGDRVAAARRSRSNSRRRVGQR
ncbi:MAG TPA: hypothetical protein DCQ98_19335 [Planctomycetaceae bacterium]|nr:hypothetical protein [Planctomycetaceae bacterium]